jgi:hypothetical protein
MSEVEVRSSSSFVVFGATVCGIEGGALIQRNHGCNGHIHVDLIDAIWTNGEGEVLFAQRRESEERGFCPSRFFAGERCCDSDNPKAGWFLYP